MRDEDFPELVELVRGGIQAPRLPMPFIAAWHEKPYQPGAPDGFPSESLSWWWAQRSQYAPEKWQLALTVRHDGQLVGMQDLITQDFAHTRHVETGSWLGLPHQGKGTGTLMRQLAVGFAFDELGALSCGSGYIVGNHASSAVSRKTGYRENGVTRIAQINSDGKVGVDVQQVLVTPESYIRPDDEVTVHGAAQLRRFLGIKN